VDGKIATDAGNMGPLHEWMPAGTILFYFEFSYDLFIAVLLTNAQHYINVWLHISSSFVFFTHNSPLFSSHSLIITTNSHQLTSQPTLHSHLAAYQST
jgi:hypothetical protein